MTRLRWSAHKFGKTVKLSAHDYSTICWLPPPFQFSLVRRERRTSVQKGGFQSSSFFVFLDAKDRVGSSLTFDAAASVQLSTVCAFVCGFLLRPSSSYPSFTYFFLFIADNSIWPEIRADSASRLLPTYAGPSPYPSLSLLLSCSIPSLVNWAVHFSQFSSWLGFITFYAIHGQLCIVPHSAFASCCPAQDHTLHNTNCWVSLLCPLSKVVLNLFFYTTNARIFYATLLYIHIHTCVYIYLFSL